MTASPQSLSYLSVCSGIEAASVAWEPLGFQPLAFSEIEPFPSAVLAHHWPDVPNLGDMTRHAEWPSSLTPDLLVGGTPCQAFSVAGLRKGLADPRGNLTLVFLGILEQFRPKWMVWENVPGVLSDKTGAFGAFLGGLGKLGYGFAYRVLDAQHFGIPQRRRRVFVVGRLGDWRHAAAVLFEPESMRGDSPPRREAGEGTTPNFTAGTLDSRHAGGFQTAQSAAANHLIPQTIGTLMSRGKAVPGNTVQDAAAGLLIPHLANPLTARMAKGINSTLDEGQTPIVCNLIACEFCGYEFDEGCGRYGCPNCHGEGLENRVAHSLRGEGFDASKDGTGRGTPLVPTTYAATDYKDGKFENVDLAGPLTTSADRTRSAPVSGAFQEAQTGVREYPTAGTLRADGSGHDPVGTRIGEGSAVRRLTPTECERLQGFPDGHTLIPWRGKPANQCPDGPRYKALGNSMAVPVMRWIGQRLQAVQSLNQPPRP